MYKKIVLVSLILLLLMICLTSCQRSARIFAVSSDGVRVHYHTAGRGETALVFIHGWGCDLSYWDEQVPYFINHYTVVALDLGGHGHSGQDREAWTVEAFGKDVQAVVEKLRLKDVVLIGHSMGGPIAVEAARLLPGLVKGIIGVDTFQNIGDPPPPEMTETWMAPLRTDFVSGTKSWVRQFFFAPGADTALITTIAEDMASQPPEVALNTMENMWKYNLANTLKEVRLPIRGINADLYPVNTESAREHALSFDVTFMSGVGHFLFIEKPDEFNRLLDETITAILEEDPE